MCVYIYIYICIRVERKGGRERERERKRERERISYAKLPVNLDHEGLASSQPEACATAEAAALQATLGFGRSHAARCVLLYLEVHG